MERVEVAADAEELAERAAGEVETSLREAIERRGRARWVLTGGSTPRRLYERLAARPEALDWRQVELFWGDERCVPPGDEGSNFRLARDTLLAALPLAGERVHRIRGELPPAEAARRYGREVEAALAGDRFDLVLLGLGADGHVASLFPGSLPEAGGPAAAVAAPVEPRWRVTLTPRVLSRARRRLLLVSGRAKAAAVARALDPARRAAQVVDRVRPGDGETVWLLDRAAAAEACLW